MVPATTVVLHMVAIEAQTSGWASRRMYVLVPRFVTSHSGLEVCSATHRMCIERIAGMLWPARQHVTGVFYSKLPPPPQLPPVHPPLRRVGACLVTTGLDGGDELV